MPHVIGTASTANVERVVALGVEESIDHARTRFEDAVAPVDVVFVTTGGDKLSFVALLSRFLPCRGAIGNDDADVAAVA
jgi:hypothetical protein